MSLGLLSRWNIIDKMIFSIENAIKRIWGDIRDSSAKEPDVELMIAAETEHLMKENENLKKREIPLYLIEEGTNAICPKCRACLPRHNAINIKYCPNCGHRVTRFIRTERYNRNPSSHIGNGDSPWPDNG